MKPNIFIFTTIIAVIIIFCLLGVIAVLVYPDLNRNTAPIYTPTPTPTPVYTITPQPTVQFLEPIVGSYADLDGHFFWHFYSDGTFIEEPVDHDPLNTERGLWIALGNSQYQYQVTTSGGRDMVTSPQTIQIDGLQLIIPAYPKNIVFLKISQNPDLVMTVSISPDGTIAVSNS